MNARSITHGLWEKTAPRSEDFDTLEGELKTDVAIIGGGYTGLSAALHLAREKTAALVLEAEHIGFGGAGRNVGLVNAGLWLMPSEVIDRLGTEMGEELVQVLGKSPDLVFSLIEQYQIACEAVREGTLHCAHSKAGFRSLEQRESQWLERGAPVQLLDREKAAPFLGSNAYHGALLDKRAGTVQPLAYALGLAEAARKEGAQIYTQSPVIAIDRENNGWALKTPGGLVRARAVILAVQGYAAHAFENMGQQLIPFNYFQFATDPLPEKIQKTILPGRQGAWDTNLVLSSYRMDQSGRLIVGSVGQVDRMGYNLHKSWAERTIKRVFPQVGKAALAHAWYGRIAMTPNHIPRFHILGPDFITVTSYNGRGIGPGSVFGKLMAAYLTKGSDARIPLPLSEPENIFLRNVRGLYYETGARLYHLMQRRI